MRGRTVVLLGMTTLLGIGAYYAQVAMTAAQGWKWCMEAPLDRQGATLLFPLWTVTGIDGPDRYRISKLVKDVPIDGSSEGMAVGSTVSVSATFDWNGGSPIGRQTDVEIHHLRVWKERLGVIGFVVLGLLLPICFRLGSADGRRWLAERGGPWPT